MPLPFLAIALRPRYCVVRDSACNIAIKVACGGQFSSDTHMHQMPLALSFETPSVFF